MKEQQIIKSNSDLIWTIANLLRGPYRPPQYRRVMIPLTVLRRLDCVLVDSKEKVLAEYAKLKANDKMKEDVIEKIINNKFGLHFHNVSDFTFQSLLNDPDNIAANLAKYISGFSSNARNILEKFEFDKEIEKLDEANRLYKIMGEFSTVDLHPDKVSNIAMGYLFENLVGRFNEQANEEAGDHFTPREVIKLMVHLLYTNDDIYTPGIVKTIYDPTCGTGGMLSVSEEYIMKNNPDANLKIFGQEYNSESYAICGSDLLIKSEDVTNIAYGDTLGTGKSKEGQVDGDGHPDKKFHYMLANPPFGVEWKPEKDFVTSEYDNLGFDGRFGPGLPRINDGALLFLLHMISKMQDSPKNGGDGSRIGIVFNGSPLFTGDAGSGESNIRRWIIENDMLESVISLPDQLFYNTGIFTYIWIISNRKCESRKGKVQLIDATKCFEKKQKSLGNKRNEIPDDKIDDITCLYGEFKEEATSKIFNNQDFGYLKIVVERPLRLNFLVNDERINRFKTSNYFTNLTVSKKRKDAKGKEKDVFVGEKKQTEIIKVLETLKSDEIIKDRAIFDNKIKKAFKDSTVKLDTTLKKVLFATDALGKKDPTAEICIDSKGNLEPDTDLRDTENVNLPDGITLPLPLDYETKKTKGKVSKSDLLDLVKEHCEEYLKREVLPYRSDAWIDHSKIKAGYEIPFTRHFYKYEPPRPLNIIEKEIKTLETDIMNMLKGITE